MGSEDEEEVDEGAVESCCLGLSWEFSCKEEGGASARCSLEAARGEARSREQNVAQRVTSTAGWCARSERDLGADLLPPSATPARPAGRPYLLAGVTGGGSCQGWHGALRGHLGRGFRTVLLVQRGEEACGWAVLSHEGHSGEDGTLV